MQPRLSLLLPFVAAAAAAAAAAATTAATTAVATAALRNPYAGGSMAIARHVSQCHDDGRQCFLLLLSTKENIHKPPLE